jgi:hypothetical protein
MDDDSRLTAAEVWAVAAHLCGYIFLLWGLMGVAAFNLRVVEIAVVAGALGVECYVRSLTASARAQRSR